MGLPDWEGFVGASAHVQCRKLCLCVASPTGASWPQEFVTSNLSTCVLETRPLPQPSLSLWAGGVQKGARSWARQLEREGQHEQALVRDPGWRWRISMERRVRLYKGLGVDTRKGHWVQWGRLT